MQISIDCAPGTQRPDTVLAGICAKLGLDPVRFVVSARVFGEWTFTVDEEYESVYAGRKEEVVSELTVAYHRGQIRFASY
jgi:hypothetical protein